MSSFAMVEGLRLRRKVRIIVVGSDLNILLIRPYGYSDDCWTLPGGGVESGEKPIEAASRELHEELGLQSTDILRLMPLNVRSQFTYAAEYKGRRSLDHDGQLAEIFLCKVPSGLVIRRQVEEIAEFCWFRVADALDAIRIPAQKRLFRRCLERLEADGFLQSAA